MAMLAPSPSQTSQNLLSIPQPLIPQPLSIPQALSISQIPQAPPIAPLPPITQLYQSSCQQLHGHPATSTPASNRFQPYANIGSLGLPTGHANQARMASASSTIPHSVSLPRWGSRQTCGPAQMPPILLQTRKPRLDNCMVQGATLPTICIKFLVYSPLVSHPLVKYFNVLQEILPKHKKKQLYLVFWFLKDSSELWMDDNHLLYRYEVPLAKSLSSVLSQITAEMACAFSLPSHTIPLSL